MTVMTAILVLAGVVGAALVYSYFHVQAIHDKLDLLVSEAKGKAVELEQEAAAKIKGGG